MYIRSLIENTSCKPGLASEHGLSLYIEALGKKLIFDFGESGAFADNAKAMGVDLSTIDMGILSHGHYDHGGGMERFFNENSKAPVYIHSKAFEKHCAGRIGDDLRNIGLDPALKDRERIIYTQGVTAIQDGITLFSDVPGTRLVSETNRVLLDCSSDPKPDSFDHEQNLLIEENGFAVLISGCAHRGIVNIIQRSRELSGRWPDVVIGGFHLSNPKGSSDGMYIPVEETARELLSHPGMYYTCHCTGLESYNTMSAIMGDRIAYLSGGMELSF